MFERLRAAYYAGWRAGVARPRIQYRNGNADRRGIKVIIMPECQLKGWLPALLWELGWHDGAARKLNKRA